MSQATTIVFPLFGQSQTHLTEEELEQWLIEQRAIIRKEVNNPGVQALFNQLERLAARLQAAGIQRGATEYDQGMAGGASYIYQVVRTCLEDQPPTD